MAGHPFVYKSIVTSTRSAIHGLVVSISDAGCIKIATNKYKPGRYKLVNQCILFGHVNSDLVVNPKAMFQNYVKIILRNLRRYKSYTMINVLGMGIGIAAMVWGYQAFQFAFSFDNFHEHQDKTYRALTNKTEGGGPGGIFPMPAVQMAKNDFPGIKDAVRFNETGMNIRYRDNETFSEKVYFADPAFFDLFNFPLAAGEYAMSDRSAVLITQKIAKKYFGNQDPIGKVLTFHAGENYSSGLTIKGVLKDLPVNSTMQFDIITNFENMLKDDGSKILPNDWSLFIDAAFFYIPDPANAARVEKEMAKYLPFQNKAREDARVSSFKLITIHQNATWRDIISSNSLYERPDDAAAFGPLVLAFLIFLSACLNFSNTTVAHAGRRLKEIGMRKVMGSTYRQLIGQLLAECFIIVAISVLLSGLLNTLWLPAFNNMFIGVKLEADYFHDHNLSLFIGCMALGATLLAGSYPAFYLSRFNPTSIFRGSVKFGGSNLFSRVMLCLQLSIAMITVIAGIAFARNAKFQRTYDYGYNIENNIGVNLNDTSLYLPFKNRLSTITGIAAIAGTRNHIGYGHRNVVSESGGVKNEVNFLEVGRTYPEAMGLKLIAGRGFDGNMQSDYTAALLITEKMAAMYNWNTIQALGKRIRIDSIDYAVVGVLKDFHSGNMFDASQPVAIKLASENRYRFLIVQAKSGDLATTFTKVKDAWKALYPLKPFNGFYQNELRAQSYMASDSIAKIFLWFAMVSILLTATGLFALVSLTTLKKTREIALRKVVGASPRHVLVLINKGYFWVFIAAVVLGCSSGWALTKLLLDTIFKINVGVNTGSLMWSAVALFVVAGITSGIKVWQAIRTNPVQLLRVQ